jgi:Fe2+ transport system protein FeoA
VITALSALRTGQTAVLVAVGGERGYRRRLLELGFVPGTSLRLVRRVDVGDILEVELRHSRVSLRLSEARSIEVDLGPLAVSGGAVSGGATPGGAAT